MKIEQVGVIGAGTMGSGIAQAFAVAGFPVVLQDLTSDALDRARSGIAKSLGKLADKGVITREASEAAIGRIVPTTAMEDMADCDLIVEAIVEKLDAKTATLKRLDEICGEEAIFASNTSSIPLTALAAASRRPGRVIGMHFFNPVPLMALIEIIPALQTESAVTDAVFDVARAIGKTPRLSRDSCGFVVNRVLVPMINEAINCVAEGVATPEDVDSMMMLGANHPIGPLALADLIGLDIVLDVMETLYDGFNDPKYRPSPLLKQMVAAGYLGRKTGRGFATYDAPPPRRAEAAE
ncbi:MAG: 3-hydroxybutyryl-CoA dehydrogenase [Bauldia sp.]|nr:3-hydroxybutyryl-CoA dehydrogenase [Bauldia sp.]